MSAKIFLNYRRGDDPGNTGRLFDRLQDAFSPEQLFLDVDNIAPGLDFVRVLEDRVAECEIVLAIIGKGWIDARDEKGLRRLDNPTDFVRVEIESALNLGKRVIPVLVGDAHMPHPDELPEALRPLARRNAVRLTHERFRADTEGLVKALRQTLDQFNASHQSQPKIANRTERPFGPLSVAFTIAGVTALVFGGAFAYWSAGRPERPETVTLPQSLTPTQSASPTAEATPTIKPQPQARQPSTFSQYIQFKADFRGSSEVPPTTSSGTGTATVTYDPSSKQVTWEGSFFGLSGPATAAHIHAPADPGRNAGVIVPLSLQGVPFTSPFKGSATLTDDRAAALSAALTAGQAYINIHTAANPGGEVRGQLRKQ
jgi:hypothetical protein